MVCPFSHQTASELEGMGLLWTKGSCNTKPAACSPSYTEEVVALAKPEAWRCSQGPRPPPLNTRTPDFNGATAKGPRQSPSWQNGRATSAPRSRDLKVKLSLYLHTLPLFPKAPFDHKPTVCRLTGLKPESIVLL